MKKKTLFLFLGLIVLSISLICFGIFSIRENEKSNLQISNIECKSMQLSANYELNSVKITASVYPTNAYDTTLNWTLSWASSSEEIINDYITISISEDTLSATIYYLKPFNTLINLKVQSISNTSVSATCSISCYKVPVELSNQNNINYPISNVFNQNSYSTIISSYKNDYDFNTVLIDINLIELVEFTGGYYNFDPSSIIDFMLKFNGVEDSYYKKLVYNFELSEELQELLSNSDIYDNISTGMSDDYSSSENLSFNFNDLLKSCLLFEDEGFNDSELMSLYNYIFSADLPLFKVNYIIEVYKDTAKTQLHSTHELCFYLSFKNINIETITLVESISLDKVNLIF